LTLPFNWTVACDKLGEQNQAIKDMKAAAKLGDKMAQDYLIANGINF